MWLTNCNLNEQTWLIGNKIQLNLDAIIVVLCLSVGGFKDVFSLKFCNPLSFWISNLPPWVLFNASIYSCTVHPCLIAEYKMVSAKFFKNIFPTQNLEEPNQISWISEHFLVPGLTKGNTWDPIQNSEKCPVSEPEFGNMSRF